jgi:hypothetical protein
MGVKEVFILLTNHKMMNKIYKKNKQKHEKYIYKYFTNKAIPQTSFRTDQFLFK